MRWSGLTPGLVALDTRQQQLTAGLVRVCEGSKLKAVHDHPTSRTPICRVITNEPQQCREAETMRWHNPDEEPAVKAVLLLEDTAAQRETIRRVREREAKVGVAVWMWWTNGSQSDDGRVGATAVCMHRNCWKPFRSHLGT